MVYIGEDSARNYTYDTRYANPVETDWTEISLNKSHIAEACGTVGQEYICNFTFAKNTAWTSPDSWSLKRAVEMSPNRTWISSDGETWTEWNRELFVRLSYYDNASLDKIPDYLKSASNQVMARASACAAIKNVLSQSDGFPISEQIAQRCYLTQAQQIMDDSRDGVYSEGNGMTRIGQSNSIIYAYGYSPHYQALSEYHMAKLYELTGNHSYLEHINNSLNTFRSYFIYANSDNTNLTKPNGFGSRGTSEGDSMYLLGDHQGYNSLAFFAMMAPHSEQAAILANYSYSYIVNGPAQESNAARFVGWTYTLYNLYKNFPASPIGEGQLSSNQERYQYVLDDAKLYTVGTQGYRVYGAFGDTTSSGGVIGNVHNRQTEQHLFSGVTGDYGNNTFGLGVLNSGNISENGYSNALDTGSIGSVLSASYPYKLNFYGNLTRVNVSQKSDIEYNTTYTFHDGYIEVNQTTTSTSELQLWSVSTETLGVGTLRGVEVSGNRKNNVTIIPLNVQLNYEDGSAEASWGTIDKFNASGTSFNYIVQVGESEPLSSGSGWVRFNNSLGRTVTVPVFGVTNALSYLPNGSVCGSLSVEANDDNITCTTPTANVSTSLDNYNKTEGYSRPFDPIAFSHLSATVKSLNSSLAQDIHNVTAVVYTNGTVPESPRFVSHSGGTTKTYGSGEYTYDASAGTLELIVPVIEPSAASNNISLDSLAPRISVTSPTQALVMRGSEILFKTSVTEANLDEQSYEFVGEGSGKVVFDGNEYVAVSPGTHTVRFCASDTSGNEACSGDITFTVLAGEVITSGGGGSGGSGSDGSTTSGDGDDSGEAGDVAGEPALLGSVNASANLGWIYGVSYPVTVKVYDVDGKPMDTPFITVRVVGNTTGTSGELVRLGKGIYQQSFTIEEAGSDKVIISVEVTHNGRTATDILAIDMREASGTEKALAIAKNTSGSIITRAYHLVAGNLLPIAIGFGVIVLLVLLVVQVRRS